jgi:hypothetical protein
MMTSTPVAPHRFRRPPPPRTGAGVGRICNHDGWGKPEFGILNVYTNTSVHTGYKTREDAYAYLNSIEC